MLYSCRSSGKKSTRSCERLFLSRAELRREGRGPKIGLLAMLFLSRSPPRVLAPFVERLWLLSDVPPHARERIVPGGTLELVVNLAADEIRIEDPTRGAGPRRLSGALVSGAYSRPFRIDTRTHASILGVHFRPGGAFPFLGARASELADAHVELDLLWGRGARELRERLCAANDPVERFRLLEEALIARLSRAPRRHPAVAFALGCLERPGASVGELPARVGLSHRRLIEVFSNEVGMTPKRFARVRRFHRAAALAGRSMAVARSPRRDAPTWSALAIDAGYADQAHMIREFVEFSGFTPSDYVSRLGDRLKEDHLRD